MDVIFIVPHPAVYRRDKHNFKEKFDPGRRRADGRSRSAAIVYGGSGRGAVPSAALSYPFGSLARGQVRSTARRGWGRRCWARARRPSAGRPRTGPGGGSGRAAETTATASADVAHGPGSGTGGGLPA